jgi:hypothetical protein
MTVNTAEDETGDDENDFSKERSRELGRVERVAFR